MKTILLVMLSVTCFASEIPNAPSHSKLEKIIFWSTAGADFASSFYDTHITEVGIHSGGGCYEKNGGDPYPSSAKLYGKNIGITGGIFVASWAMRKYLHLPIAPEAAMAVDTFKHAHGIHSWYTFKNGACL